VPPCLFREGPKAVFFVYVDDQDRCPVIDFIDNDITTEEKRRLIRRFEYLLQTDPPYNKEYFRYEGKGIYAIKSNYVRILCFFLRDAPRRTLVLTNGFKKKSQKAPPEELKKAIRIMNEINPK